MQGFLLILQTITTITTNPTTFFLQVPNTDGQSKSACV